MCTPWLRRRAALKARRRAGILLLVLGALASAGAAPAAARPIGPPYVLDLTGTNPRVVFNQQDGRYLVSAPFVGHGLDWVIHLADVASSGAPDERGFPSAGAATFSGDVAFDASRNRYLVVYAASPWSVGRLGPDGIYGELRAGDGRLLAKPVILALGYGVPVVAYDRRHDQYLLVILPSAPLAAMGAGLVGVRLDGDLQPLGAPFAITHRLDLPAIRQPAVVYRPAARDFVVTWIGQPADAGASVFAQRVSAGGTPFGPEDLDVSTGADAHGVDGQALAASTDNVDVVVTWGDGGAVYARRLGQRLPLGPLRRISRPENTAGYPAVAYQPRAREWLVAWGGVGPESPVDQHGNRVAGIFGQHLSTYRLRELGPDDFPISERLATPNPEPPMEDLHAQFDPAIGADPSSRDYLVAWDADFSDAFSDFRIMVRRVTVEPPS